MVNAATSRKRRSMVPCCELLSSCRRSQGKVCGARSVPSPQWCGGSLPPTRSCPGWSPPEDHHAPPCLQRCCIPQSVEESNDKTMIRWVNSVYRGLLLIKLLAAASSTKTFTDNCSVMISFDKMHFVTDFLSEPKVYIYTFIIILKATIHIECSSLFK